MTKAIERMDPAGAGLGHRWTRRFPAWTWRCVLVAMMAAGARAQETLTYSITTYAGSAGLPGSANGSTTSARFFFPTGAAMDRDGNLYVSDSNNHTIRKISTGGDVSTLAGTAGTSGSTNGTGTAAQFNNPLGLAVDASGNVFVADTNNHLIRRITPAGVVTTFAGGAGVSGSLDGTGTGARFNRPAAVAVDSAGNVLVADGDNQTIRRISSSGVVTTIAGQAGVVGASDGVGNAARFYVPYGIAVDGAGDAYVADYYNNTIRRVTPNGVVTTVAGAALIAGSTDGTVNAARFNNPSAVALDLAGNVFVSDTVNQTIRRISKAGDVTTLAGMPLVSGSANGIGSAARFNSPRGLVVDSQGRLYVADLGNHTIRVGSAASGTAPVIVEQPASRTVNAGQPVTFTVFATGLPPPSYQWRKNGTAIAGATATTFTIPSVTANDAGSYTVVVSNTGGSVTSNAATLTVGNQPAFTLHPASIAVPVGQPAAFAVAVTGTPAPTLQWQLSTDEGRSWQNVAGATAATLTIPSVAQNQNGHQYRVVASSTSGTATSNSATLTILGSVVPTITTQPLGGTYRADQAVQLSVLASGTQLQYRWFKDGVPLSNGTSPTLSIPSAQERDSGTYFVEVTNSAGRATSQSAIIVVQSPPRFFVQPANTTVERGLNTSFTVAVSGVPAPTVQWYARTGTAAFAALSDKPPYSGTNTNVLRISAADATLDGVQVQARATNALGSTDSAIATLRVVAPTIGLRIRNQPQSRTVRAGADIQFAVEMEGPAPVTFQWSKDGIPLPGSTQSVCNLPRVSAAAAGGYSVVVRDSVGGIVTSTVASLTVVGAVDSTFDPKGGANGAITSVLGLNAGGYLVVGSFTRVAGVPRAGIAKLLADGSVATDFDPGVGANGPIRAVIELTGGRFLVVGQFDRFNGVTVPGVVRLSAQGQVDTAFNPSLPAPPANDTTPVLERFHFTVIGLPGGGYLLGGRAGIVGINPTGGVIPGTLYNLNGPVFALLVQFNGGIIVGGDFSAVTGVAGTFPRLLRLLSDYRIDPAFNVGTGPNALVDSLLRSPDGWIYVFGSFSSFNGRPRPGIARIAPNGRLDENFNPVLSPPRAASMNPGVVGDPARAAASRLQANNGIILPNGGVVPPPIVGPTTTAQAITSVNPDGEVSGTFDVSVNGSANALAPSSTEGVAVAGDFTNLAGNERANMAVVTDDTAGSRMVNLSTRGRVAGGERNIFLGFVIKGPESMRVLIRAVGPTLRAFGITDPLARPELTLYDGTNAVITVNRGWRTNIDPDGIAAITRQVGGFELSSTDDAALVLNLAPGNYTAQISGVNDGQGVALAEVYAVDHGSSRLINLSVRGAVGTGDDVLIPAFVVTGGPRLLLMRTIGPGLAQFGVSGALARPSMELRRSAVLLETNQGWASGFDPAAIQARTPLVGAFPLNPQSADAAIMTPLSAGAYTVTARGADGGTGVALVEIYDANGVEKPALNP